MIDIERKLQKRLFNFMVQTCLEYLSFFLNLFNLPKVQTFSFVPSFEVPYFNHHRLFTKWKSFCNLLMQSFSIQKRKVFQEFQSNNNDAFWDTRRWCLLEEKMSEFSNVYENCSTFCKNVYKCLSPPSEIIKRKEQLRVRSNKDILSEWFHSSFGSEVGNTWVKNLIIIKSRSWIR